MTKCNPDQFVSYELCDSFDFEMAGLTAANNAVRVASAITAFSNQHEDHLKDLLGENDGLHDDD